jgi:hypothetical protein
MQQPKTRFQPIQVKAVGELENVCHLLIGQQPGMIDVHVPGSERKTSWSGGSGEWLGGHGVSLSGRGF